MMELDELFGGEPIEHLIRILQNASPRAIENTIEEIVAEYVAMQNLLEKHGLLDELDKSSTPRDALQSAKNDLYIRVMSVILSQE